MNRRELLTSLAAAALAPAALWVPDRTIFLPPRGGWPGSWDDTEMLRARYGKGVAGVYLDGAGMYLIPHHGSFVRLDKLPCAGDVMSVRVDGVRLTEVRVNGKRVKVIESSGRFNR